MDSDTQALQPTQSIHLEADYSAALIQQVSEGSLDVALTLVGEAAPGLLVERLFSDRLLMVSTEVEELESVNPDRYIYLNWGWGYTSSHSERLPQLRNAPVMSGLASVGTQWLNKQGGTAYLPERLIEKELQEGNLKKVIGAPQFELPVYLLYSTDSPFPDRIDLAVRTLNQVIKDVPDNK